MTDLTSRAYSRPSCFLSLLKGFINFIINVIIITVVCCSCNDASFKDKAKK